MKTAIQAWLRLLTLGVVIPSLSVGALAGNDDDLPRERDALDDAGTLRWVADRVAREDALNWLVANGPVAPPLVAGRGSDLEVVRRDKARKDMIALAAAVQTLYDLKGVSGVDEDFRKQVERQSKDSAKLAKSLLKFVNRETKPPVIEAIPVRDDGFPDRVQRLAGLYRELMYPVAEFITVDVLDLGKLAEVRFGLMQLEALAESIPQALPRADSSK